MDTLPPHVENGNFHSAFPDASGIYKITCTINKKIYIGSAVSLRKRHNNHLNKLRHGIHENPKLQSAWNKYGEQAFTFEILELVLVLFLIDREQYWLDKLKPFGQKGFNIALKAGSCLGVLGKKHTPETRAKISRAHLGKKMPPESIERTRQANLGRKKTPESIEKQRHAMIGRKMSPESIEKTRQAHLGKKRTPETCEKISAAQRGKPAHNLGKKASPETVEKNRQTHLGKKASPETREKMRQSHLKQKGGGSNL